MRRIAGVVCLVLGVLLVALGAIVRFVAAPSLVKAPLDVDRVTVATGTSQVFVVQQQKVVSVPVVATRTVTGDKSAGTSAVAVYDETLCLRIASSPATDKFGCVASTDPGFIQKTTDRIAFDRKKGTAVANTPKFKAAVDGDGSIAHEGLGYTFPIDTKKQTYQFFDTVLGKAFPMSYQGTEKIDGLNLYRFQQAVPSSSIKINGLLPGTYSNTRIVWVEPTTGIIVKGSEQIEQRFQQGDSVAFSGTLVFDDKTVASQASWTKDQLSKIHLIRLWLPLGLLVVGLLLVVLAVWLMLSRRRPRRQRSQT